MTRVRIADIAKAFGSVLAVRGVTLEVGEGEFFSLLGPSGCGKTTTLRMLAGLERPSRGEIWFGEERVTDTPPQARNVGLVFQSYAVFPTMSVYDNVAYGLRIRRLPDPEVRRRATAALEMVGLQALADRMPGAISGGQLQRVALARALAIRPRLLLLDEPLSNLDAKLRVEVRGEIRRLQRDVGITTIYVTHDQDEALSLSDRVGVMNQGLLEQVGRPDEIYTRPATEFVAGFVGEGTLLDGILAYEREQALVTIAPGARLPVQDPAGTPPGRVWVCIRPEAVTVRPDSTPAGAGVLRGIVQRVEYVGAVIRVDVRVPDIERPLRLTMWSLGGPSRLQPGSTVRLAVDPKGVIVGRSQTPAPTA
jgi:putative spermidine/putrescine transport system ATP-binding protein